MKMRMSLLTLFVILSSCAHKLPDSPVCISVSERKGFCTYTISNKEYFLQDKEWHDLKNKSLVMPIDSWAEIKIFILQICKDYGKCEDAQEKLNQIDFRLY